MDILRKSPAPKRTSPPARRFFLTDMSVGHSGGPQETKGGRPLQREQPRWPRYLLFILTAALILIIGAAGISFLAGMTLTRSLHFENRELSFFDSLREVGRGYFQKTIPLKGEADGRINILLLGRAGENYPGKNLTDTIIIMSIDTRQSRVALLSLPRDLFVPIAGTALSTKLNALYQYSLNADLGTELVSQSVSHITGIPLPYTAVIDFEGFERVIDALGGIRVEVLRDIYDPRYPGKNYSYETFELKAGWQKLDGKTALKYARERHNDPEGDFGRAKRQQQIIQAVADRAFSIPTFLNPFTLYNFFESLGESITTNISPEEIHRFLELARVLDRRNVESTVVDAWKRESLLRVDHLDTATGRAFLLVPRSGSWDEIRDLAANLFDQKKMRGLRAKIEREETTLTILSSTKYEAAARTLLASIQNEFPLARVRLESLSALDKIEETAMIRDTTGLAKPFTLDALIKRYALLKKDSLPITLPSDRLGNADFFLLFTKKDFDDTLVTQDLLQSLPLYDFQEPLSPQPAKASQ